MEEIKISSKGQIVIPKYIRDFLMLTKGSVLIAEVLDNKIILMKKPEDPVKSLVEQESIMKNIRREIKEE